MTPTISVVELPALEEEPLEVPLIPADISESSGRAGVEENTEEIMVQAEDDGQELDIPPTPDFGMSPNSPKTTSTTMFPRTPGTYNVDARSPSFKELEARPTFYARENPRDEVSVDPTTIFVGGLEFNGPNAWNEERITDLFSRYGSIEDTKFIIPGIL